MKPNYKNWIPKGMLFALIAGTAVSLVGALLFGAFGVGVKGGLRIALGVVFAIALLSYAAKARSGASAPIMPFPMTESESFPNRLSTERRSILHFPRAEWDWMSAAAAAR